MSTSATWNVSWLVENTQRDYPLVAGSSGLDTTGVRKIPDNFLANMQLTGTVDPTACYISRILYTGPTFEISIHSGSTLLGKFSVPQTAADFSDHTFLPAVPGTAAGFMTVGSMETISTWSPGIYSYTSTTAKLELDVLRPSLGNIGFYVANGSSLSEPLTSSVVLKAGPNIRFDSATYGTKTIVTISAVANQSYNAKCTECPTASTGGGSGPDSNTSGVPKPIRQINGITGDENGNFELNAIGCYKFSNIANGLELENTCTDPCCSCEQIDAVFSEVRQFINQATTLQDFAERLRQGIDRINTATALSPPGVGNCPTST